MRRCSVPRAAILAALTAGWGCAWGEASTRDEHGPADSSSARPAHADTVPAAAQVPAPVEAPVEPGVLRTVAAERVQGWTGPGGQPFEVTRRTAEALSGHARRFGTRTLEITLRARTPDLGQYPCTSCHLGAGLVPGEERVSDAHQNIQPVHPAETGATCGTCHSPEDVELLAFKSSRRAPLDHAYRVCAQCHFAQVEAWAAGAHGKRLDGWQGRRVVMGCADCHDPHRPALERRIPFRPPRLHRTGSETP